MGKNSRSSVNARTVLRRSIFSNNQLAALGPKSLSFGNITLVTNESLRKSNQ